MISTHNCTIRKTNTSQPFSFDIFKLFKRFKTDDHRQLLWLTKKKMTERGFNWLSAAVCSDIPRNQNDILQYWNSCYNGCWYCALLCISVIRSPSSGNNERSTSSSMEYASCFRQMDDCMETTQIFITTEYLSGSRFWIQNHQWTDLKKEVDVFGWTAVLFVTN